jgi:macrodomain Ter protein organizer (MatP/YcbG family)
MDRNNTERCRNDGGERHSSDVSDCVFLSIEYKPLTAFVQGDSIDLLCEAVREHIRFVVNKVIDKEVSQAMDAKISQAIDAKISQAIDKNIAQAVDASISQNIYAELSRTVDIKISQAIDAKISQAIDAKISEAIETKVVPTIEAKISQAVEEKVPKTLQSGVPPAVSYPMFSYVPDPRFTPYSATGDVGTKRKAHQMSSFDRAQASNPFTIGEGSFLSFFQPAYHRTDPTAISTSQIERIIGTKQATGVSFKERVEARKARNLNQVSRVSLGFEYVLMCENAG